MVRRRLIVAVFIAACLIFGGCRGYQPVISLSKLADTERELLNAVGITHYVVYDVNTRGLDVEKLELWADYYSGRQFKEKLFHCTSTASPSRDEDMRLVFSAFTPKPGTDEETWVISFGSGRLTKPVVRLKRDLVTGFERYNS